ncbi:hypothetical protein BGZ67_000534, partial [Mortierella alpina]
MPGSRGCIVPRPASPISSGTELELLDSGSNPPSCTLSASPIQPASKQPLDVHVRDSNESTPAFQELLAKNAQKWQAPSPNFANKLEEAAKDPNLQSYKKQTKSAMRLHLSHGLVVNTDPSRRTLGNFIVQHLLQPTFPTNTRLLFVHRQTASTAPCTSSPIEPCLESTTPPEGASIGLASVVSFILWTLTSLYRVPSPFFREPPGKRCIQRQNAISSIVAHSQPSSSAVVPAPPPTSSSLTSSSSSSSSSSQSISVSPSAAPPGQHTQSMHARYRAHGRAPKRRREALDIDSDSRRTLKRALTSSSRLTKILQIERKFQ